MPDRFLLDLQRLNSPDEWVYQQLITTDSLTFCLSTQSSLFC